RSFSPATTLESLGPQQPFPSRLTTRQSLLSALFATHPEIPGVTPLFATLPKSRPRKSFICHTCETPPRGPRRLLWVPVATQLDRSWRLALHTTYNLKP